MSWLVKVLQAQLLPLISDNKHVYSIESRHHVQWAILTNHHTLHYSLFNSIHTWFCWSKSTNKEQHKQILTQCSEWHYLKFVSSKKEKTLTAIEQIRQLNIAAYIETLNKYWKTPILERGYVFVTRNKYYPFFCFDVAS